MCCLGTAVMAGVGFELGCEGLERMGRMGDGRDGTAVKVGVSDACTTTVIPAKAGIQRGGATGRRTKFNATSPNPL